MAARRLSISFSGGRTSGYMLWRMLRERGEYDEVVVTFANTGQEHPKTLEFVDRCDREFGAGVVWIEAKINPVRGIGTGHVVVDFATACRDGRLFADFASKFGVPNQSVRSCTRELKLRAMQSYLRSIGWGPGSYTTAIGIRADEVDRMSAYAEKEKLVYPLVRWGVTKQDVRDWWARQPFDLDLTEPFGNCVWCYKKSERKLVTVARTCPGAFDVPRDLGHRFGDCGPLAAKAGTQRIFRGNRTADDILALAARDDIVSWTDAYVPSFPLSPVDETNGCEESCEVYSDADFDADGQGLLL